MSAVPPFEAVDCDDDYLLDGDTAKNAIVQLREHAQNPQQPFFLAVGFANPHVPWIAPKKYFDLYDPAQLPLAKNEFLPQGAPAFAATSGQDFRWYAGVPQGELPEPYKRQCLQGYLAAISYVDAQVGRLLDVLDETGLARNTVVVFWSDHGYYMGEHTWWGAKHNNYEGATRNCLIIAAPGQTTAGQTTAALAQSVDLAPTLTELCGLPENTGFQGRSLKPVLDDPQATVNEAAFSWYPKSGYLGVAMRTDKWRFVEWTKAGEPPVWELYDSAGDPQNDLNLATRSENAELLASLSAQAPLASPSRNSDSRLRNQRRRRPRRRDASGDADRDRKKSRQTGISDSLISLVHFSVRANETGPERHGPVPALEECMFTSPTVSPVRIVRHRRVSFAAAPASWGLQPSIR